MATKPPSPGPLIGSAAALAGLPNSPWNAPNTTDFGETVGRMMTQKPADAALASLGVGADPSQQPTPDRQPDEFAGMGPWLEKDDKTVFKQMDGLVLRQELIAQNHLAQDTHWTYVKLGYPWSTLTKIPNKDIYQQSLPYGAAGITIQAVPNKVWDLVNKTAESLLVDFPEAECEPMDDTEQAESACDMANRFLSQDGAEQGTNDAVLYHDRVTRALVTASTYIEYWVDRTGAGYVPLQILAHPQAESPDNPLVGPDGMPTPDYVLRYVTADNQFTDDASQAAPQWQPKIRASKWGREHLRVFPESATVDTAEKIIIVGYATIGELKKRLPDVAAMSPDDLNTLCDWTPARYLPLLPPFQRARWMLTDGRDKAKGGASDERIVFYYHGLARACPDYPKGADVFVSGAQGGMILGKELNAAEVSVDKGQGKTTEIRCLEIPVVQITPRGDPDEQDPSGRCFVEMFAGAAEHNSFMAMSFAQKVDQNIRMPFARVSTSSIDEDTVQDAMESGRYVDVLSINDVPQQLKTSDLPGAFFNMYEIADEAINSIATQERASQGSESSKERSGKALQIAIERNNVSLTGMQNAVNAAYARGCRLKIERCMKGFTTTQQIAYVGEDGAFKQDEWTGVDFAQIGKVRIKAGTGTLMGPDQKVQYLGNLQAAQLIPPDEAQEASRPAFAKRLGLPPNPHEQYVDRCVESWNEGPPAGWTPGAPQRDLQTGQPTMGPPSWTPFTPRPNDTESRIASIWLRKCSDAMSTVQYAAFPPEWRALLDQQYTKARQSLALTSAAAQPPGAPPGQSPSPPPPQPAPQPSAQLPNPRGSAAR